MEKTFSDIQTLIIADLTGVITPEEKQLLTHLIETDPDVNAIAEEITTFISELPPSTHENDANEVEAIIRKTGRAKRNKRLAYTLKTIAVAASILLVCFLVTRERSDPDLKMAVSTDTSKFKYATLTIGDSSHAVRGSYLTSSQDGRIKTDSGEIYRISNTSVTVGVSLEGISQVTEKPDTVSIKTPSGEIYRVRLMDGTLVVLDTNSCLTYPGRFGEYREVIIEGQAYIETGHDPTKAFFVRTGNIRLQALGTSFNVNTYDRAKVKVALLSGKLKMKSGNDEKQLAAGNAATYDGNKFDIAPLNEKTIPDWYNTIVYLEEADEKALVAAAARYFAQPIVFDRPFEGLAQVPLNRNQPVDSFIAIIPGKYRIVHTGDTMHLK